MSINTGSNPPVQRGILQRGLKSVVDKGCRINRELKDRENLYGYVLISPDHQRFFFVVKGSKLYTPIHDKEFKGKQITSVQKQMVTLALMEESPIVLAWWGNEAWIYPRIFMYNPDEILTRWRDKINKRFGIVMQNFPFWEGREIYNIERLREWWSEERRKWRVKKERTGIGKKQKALKPFLK